MATLPINRPVTPLRQRMLDDMATRAMRSRTQYDYVRHVCAFAAFRAVVISERVEHQRHGPGTPLVRHGYCACARRR